MGRDLLLWVTALRAKFSLRRAVFFVSLFSFGCLFASLHTPLTKAEAKSMAERVGIGMMYHPFGDTRALSTRYFPWEDTSLGLFFGFNTYRGTNATLLGVRAQRQLLFEENLFFFAAVAGSILSEKTSAAEPSASGIEIDATLGAEFFIPGLPNLGLAFETGLSLRSLRGVRFQTFGGALATAAVHYYF